MALPYQPLTRSNRIALAIAAALAVHLALLPLFAKEWLFKLPPQQRRMEIGRASCRERVCVPV